MCPARKDEEREYPRRHADLFRRGKNIVMNEVTLSEFGLMDLLHGGASLSSAMTRDIFLTRQTVVGTRYVGDADALVEELVPGSRVTLLHEADNRFDARAVMVIDAEGRKLGYIPRHQNAVIAALLDAGKSFYGIVPEKPQKYDDENDVSAFRFRIDLYMREFISPEDPSQVPRQGDRGSYAVTVIGFSDEERSRISAVCAIKVINGDDRGHFEETVSGDGGREELRRVLTAFDDFAGYLPIVCHGLQGAGLRTLEEAYGTALGKAFSSHVADTERMARIRLPGLEDTGLDALVKELGIGCGEEPGLMRDCILTWKLYRRLERSELDRRAEQPLRLIPLEKLRREGKLAPSLCRALTRRGLLLLGDVMDRSRADFVRMAGVRTGGAEKLSVLLESLGASLSQEDYEPTRITFQPNPEMAGADEHALKTMLGIFGEQRVEEVRNLPEDKRSRAITEATDIVLGRLREKGDEDGVLQILMTAGLAGYRGDFSAAGFSLLDGTGSLGQSTMNGYYLLSRYYTAWHRQQLEDDAFSGMMKTCVRLADGILQEDLMDGASPEDRTGAAAALLEEAVSHARYAPDAPETARILETLGYAFLQGEYDPGDGTEIRIERSPESAYKAFYYAKLYGSRTAEPMMKEALGEESYDGPV